jgi:hypothetical protein
MSSKWSKQDRAIWDNSEVMTEFEKNLSSNIEFIKKLADAQTQKTQVEGLTGAVKQLSGAWSGVEESSNKALSADDHLDPCPEGKVRGASGDCIDSEGSDELGGAKAAVIEELRSMVKAASDSGSLNLAYRIERTIEEIMDV